MRIVIGWLGIGLCGALTLAGCSGSSSPQAPPRNPTSSAPSTSGPVELAQLCATRDISVRLLGGQLATGKDLVSAGLTNTSSVACLLSGRLHFAAYFASGRRDHNAFVAADPGFASSLGSEPVNLVVAAGRSVTIVFSGAQRDDPAQPDGMCRAADEETPSRLVVTIGSLTLQIRNLGDPGPNNIPSVYGCHGAIGVAALLGT